MIRFLLSCLLALLITLLILGLMSSLVSIKNSPDEYYPFPAAKIETMPKTLMEVQTIEVKKCDDKTIAKAKDEMQQYRACKAAADCVRVDYISLNNIAINKTNQKYATPIIDGLKLICGNRTANIPTYHGSGGAIEIRCTGKTEQTGQCDVYQLPVKPKPLPKRLDFSK